MNRSVKKRNVVISNAERNLQNFATFIKISPFGRDDREVGRGIRAGQGWFKGDEGKEPYRKKYGQHAGPGCIIKKSVWTRLRAEAP